MSLGHRVTASTAALALLGMSGLARLAAAQTTANAAIAASAFVSGIAPLSAGAVQNLQFGTLAAGLTSTPTNLATNAARFVLAGQPNQPVFLTFILPTVLTSSFSATIPVTFGGSDGVQWTAFPLTHTTFNPNAPYLTALGPTGGLLISITGTVAPPAGTVTGSYSGTITMTVSY